MKATAPSEHHEQRTLFEWAAYTSAMEPRLRLLFAIPNGSNKSKAQAGRFRAEGLRAGVPDVCLPVASGGFHGLFVEMKRRTGGRLSPAQREWIAALQAQGYAAEVCLGWEHTRQAILDYLGA